MRYLFTATRLAVIDDRWLVTRLGRIADTGNFTVLLRV